MRVSTEALGGLHRDDDAPSDGRAREACEWKLDWLEAAPGSDRPRRTWKLMIDVDRTPPESDQDAHVGWSAEGIPSEEAKKTAGAVTRTLGHIWLDQVPVSRPALRQ